MFRQTIVYVAIVAVVFVCVVHAQVQPNVANYARFIDRHIVPNNENEFYLFTHDFQTSLDFARHLEDPADSAVVNGEDLTIDNIINCHFLEHLLEGSVMDVCDLKKIVGYREWDAATFQGHRPDQFQAAAKQREATIVIRRVGVQYINEFHKLWNTSFFVDGNQSFVYTKKNYDFERKVLVLNYPVSWQHPGGNFETLDGWEGGGSPIDSRSAPSLYTHARDRRGQLAQKKILVPLDLEHARQYLDNDNYLTARIYFKLKGPFYLSVQSIYLIFSFRDTSDALWTMELPLDGPVMESEYIIPRRMQQIPFDTSMLNKVISSDAAPQIFSEIAHLSASDVDRMHNNDGQAILMCAKLHIAFENYKRRFKKNPAKLSDLYKIDRDLKRIPSIQLRIEGGDFGIGYRLYFYARNINGTGFWFGRGGRR